MPPRIRGAVDPANPQGKTVTQHQPRSVHARHPVPSQPPREVEPRRGRRGGAPVDAALAFSSADPYAVTAVFHTDCEHPVRWTFGRDLLAGGLERPCGEGDVSVWPATSAEGPVACMSLCAPKGRALLEAPRAALEDFLAATYELVPAGRESEHLDLDDTFARLLSD